MRVIRVMPRAKKAEKTIPMAASSLIGERLRIKLISRVLTIEASKAPRRRLKLPIKAIANPGKTE